MHPGEPERNVFRKCDIVSDLQMTEVLQNKADQTQNAYRKPSPPSAPTGIVCPHRPIWVIVLPRHLIGRRR